MNPPRHNSPGPEDIRRRNLAAVLGQLHRNGPTTRARLAQLLRLNRSTIKTLTADLSRADLIAESAAPQNGRTGAGRPSLVVHPRAQRRYTYVFSLEPDRIRAARVGLGGQVLDRAQRWCAPDTAAMATDLIALREDIRSVSENGLAGVAVAVADPAGDAATEASRVLTAVLSQKCPIRIARSADVAALAEQSRGAAAGSSDFIYLHSDAAVSAGIVAGSRLVTGGNGYAGQVGHMVVRPGGRVCDCGGQGCWQTEIGQHGVLTSAGRDGQTGSEAIVSVVDAARRGDVSAERGLRQAADWLAFGLGNLVNLFNPQLVIFAGTLRHLYLATAATVRSRLHSIALPATRPGLRLRTPQLGDDAVLLGAAELAFEDLLNDPLGDA